MSIIHKVRCEVLAEIADEPQTSEQLSRRLKYNLRIIHAATRDLSMEGIIEETRNGWDYAPQS